MIPVRGPRDVIWPVPTDAEATEKRARVDAATMLRGGTCPVYVCRSSYRESGKIVGYRYFVLDSFVSAIVPRAGDRIGIIEVLEVLPTAAAGAGA